MAQTGYTPILIYGTTTSGHVPLAANLTTGTTGVELAINVADGKLFYKNGSGVVQTLGLSNISFGTTGLTPSSPTTGPVTVAGTLVPANGGTGVSAAPANGQVLIGNGTGYTLSTLTAGANITITNTAGGITIAAASAPTSVTSLTASTGLSVSASTGPVTITNTGVVSFNSRTGAVTLGSSDVTSALGYTPYNSSNPSGYITGAVGIGQSWQNVTGSRALSTAYTNTESIPIQISVWSGQNENGSMQLFVNGLQIASTAAEWTDGAHGAVCNVTAIIPAGATYQVNYSGGGNQGSVLGGWCELR